MAWVVGYVMRQFTCPKAVTHPSTNRARRRATALIETNALPLHIRIPINHYIFTGYDQKQLLCFSICFIEQENIIPTISFQFQQFHLSGKLNYSDCTMRLRGLENNNCDTSANGSSLLLESRSPVMYIQHTNCLLVQTDMSCVCD